uniref:DUF4206 domain-containing protein n=1 Tax=Macrostomum lignano TaxID=282301 RepID=A0A1I8F5K0_9PLAT
AAALASDSLTRSGDVPESEFRPPPTAARPDRAALLRACCWNRQLCGQQPLTSTIGDRFPDQVGGPEPAAGARGLHAIALCRVSGRLALAEGCDTSSTEMSGRRRFLAGGGGGVRSRQCGASPSWKYSAASSERPTPHSATCCATCHWWLLHAPRFFFAASRSTLDGRNPRPATRRLDGRHPSTTASSNDSLSSPASSAARNGAPGGPVRRQERSSSLLRFCLTQRWLPLPQRMSAFRERPLRPNLLSDRAAGRRKAADATADALPLAPRLLASAAPPAAAPSALVAFCWLRHRAPRRLPPRPGANHAAVDWPHWLAQRGLGVAASSRTPCCSSGAGVRAAGCWIQLAEGRRVPADLRRCCSTRRTSSRRTVSGAHPGCSSREAGLRQRQGRAVSARSDGREHRQPAVELPGAGGAEVLEAAYGQQLQLDYPTGSGMRHCLNDIIVDISGHEDALMLREYYEATSGRGVGGQRTELEWRHRQHRRESEPSADFGGAHEARTAADSRADPARNSVVHGVPGESAQLIKLDEFTPELSFDWDNDEDEDLRGWYWDLHCHGCFSRHQYLQQGNATNAICSFCNSESTIAAGDTGETSLGGRQPFVHSDAVCRSGIGGMGVLRLPAVSLRDSLQLSQNDTAWKQLSTFTGGRLRGRVPSELLVVDHRVLGVLPKPLVQDVRVHDQQERLPVGQRTLISHGSAELTRPQPSTAAHSVGQRHVVQEAASRVCRVVLDQHQQESLKQSSEALDIVHVLGRPSMPLRTVAATTADWLWKPRPAGRCLGARAAPLGFGERMSGSSRPGLSSKRYSDSRMPRTSRFVVLLEGAVTHFALTVRRFYYQNRGASAAGGQQ